MPLEANTPGTRITSYRQILIGAIAILIGRIVYAEPLRYIGAGIPAATVQQKCTEGGPKGSQAGQHAGLPVIGGLTAAVVGGKAELLATLPLYNFVWISGLTAPPAGECTHKQATGDSVPDETVL